MDSFRWKVCRKKGEGSCFYEYFRGRFGWGGRGLDGRLYVFRKSPEPRTVIQASFPGLSTSISPDGMRILAGGGRRVGYYQIASKSFLTVITSSPPERADPLGYLLIPGLFIAAIAIAVIAGLAFMKSRRKAPR